MAQEEERCMEEILETYEQIDCHHLNITDYYNYRMKNVDIFDKLKGSYRFENWMRKIKGWW